MNYEQRYKNTLERARIGLHDCNLLDCDNTTRRTAITIIHNLFPELKECDDKRIKREIVDCINAYANLKDEKIPTEWLDWLEKQGKKLDPDKVIEWIDEHVPTKFEEMQNYVNQFKKDFGL